MHCHGDHHPHHHGNPGWRRFEAMARRGFGRMPGMGPGMGRGDWGGFGDNFRIGRMLASGDLRLVALYLIEQQPRHGYDLIKAVEEKSGGFYSPSPGIVYPALTFLEEAGYVTSATEGNKKLYTITDEGRAHLADNRTAIEATLDILAKAGEKMRAWRDLQAAEQPDGDRPGPGFRGPGRHHHPFGDGPPPRPDRDMRDVLPEVNDARRALKEALARAVAQGDDAQRKVADILNRAADDLRALDPDDGGIDL